MMGQTMVRCTNCGKVAERRHILPLCNDCFRGLEDYEEFLARAANDAEVGIDKRLQPTGDFLRV